jgi:membrane protein
MAAARRLMPRTTVAEVEEFLRALVQSRHVTGGLGIAVLLWVTTGVFEIIGASLTALTGERETRSYLRRKLIALALMCTAGFLMIATMIGGWFLEAWPTIQELVQDLLGVHLQLPAFLSDPRFPRYLTSVLMAILLTIVYRVAPVKDIRWLPAIAGATIAAILWHLAKLAYNWFLIHYARLSLFYGILGGFIGLVLWIFYTAIILLVGGMLADILDRGGYPPKRRP